MAAKGTKISWNIQKFEQQDENGKMQDYYIGTAKIMEINAVCRVPSFDATDEHSDHANRILKLKSSEQQWQRPLENIRMDGINKFASNNNANIVNAVTLYLPNKSENSHVEEGSIKLIEEAENRFILEIDRIGYLKIREDGKTVKGFDIGENNVDLRPLMIVDGQHRIRGSSISTRGQNLMIPFILLPSNIGMKGAMKRFTEMNTEQAKLGDLHDLNVRYRTKQGNDYDKSYRDMRETRDANHKWFSRAKANRLAYRIAVKLTADVESQLFNRITIIENSKDKVTNTKSFCSEASFWFTESGPYEDRDDFEEIYGEIKAYFGAFAKVCNHDFDDIESWPDGDSRWINSPKSITGRPMIMHEGPFKTLLWLFPTVYSKYIQESKKRDLSNLNIEDIFIKILSPLSWIDWQDERLGIYRKKPSDVGLKSLYTWMSWAVSLGKIYDLGEVMSDDSSLCKPGRGILAPPNKEIITLTSGQNHSKIAFWPSEDGDTQTFFSQTPPNTYLHSKWEVRDETNEYRGEFKSHDNGKGFCRYVLDYKEWMDDAKELVLTVRWSNRPGSFKDKYAEKSLRIKKDGGGDLVAPSTDDDDGSSSISAIIEMPDPPPAPEGVLPSERNPDDKITFYIDGVSILPPNPIRGYRKPQGDIGPHGGIQECSKCMHGIDHGMCKYRDRWTSIYD